MKSHCTVALRRSSHRGFTLLELLVVMVIIGILAALTIGAFRWSQDSSSRSRTKIAFAAIQTALEQYQERNGEYPEPANPMEEDRFSGNTYRTGGAHMLYQAITGDGTSAIRLDAASPAGTSESDGKISEEERENVLNDSSFPKSIFYPPNIAPGTLRPRYCVDGWNHPFQYTRAQTGAGNLAVNPTYDLWSFGSAGGGVMASESAEIKRDPATTAPWIKNW